MIDKIYTNHVLEKFQIDKEICDIMRFFLTFAQKKT